MNDFFLERQAKEQEPRHAGWDNYWAKDLRGARRVYSTVASIYRRIFICTRLAYWLRRTFPANTRLLHVGCGSGEVDALVAHRYRITGLDISPAALERYRSNNPKAEGVIHADLMSLKQLPATYDGAYHLGVLEHFTPNEIARILTNLRAVVRPGGKMVVFWPLASAPSVKVLGAWHRLINQGAKDAVELHPPEVSLIRSRQEADQLIRSGGWEVRSYSVSPADLFIQAVLVCE